MKPFSRYTTASRCDERTAQAYAGHHGQLQKAVVGYGMEMRSETNKVLVTSIEPSSSTNIWMNGQVVEEVDQFEYLGSSQAPDWNFTSHFFWNWHTLLLFILLQVFVRCTVSFNVNPRHRRCSGLDEAKKADFERENGVDSQALTKRGENSRCESTWMGTMWSNTSLSSWLQEELAVRKPCYLRI